MDKLIKTTLANLTAHNMAPYYVETPEALISLLQTLLTPGERIGCGDSVTLEETGVFDFIRAGDYVFLDKHKPGLSPAEKRELYLNNFRANTFLSGVNAISQDGSLFFIDGNGSRVAPILYGPQQVILVAGTNKLTSGPDEARRRVRQLAAPMDAGRLGKRTPCASTGKCVDCKSPERICNDFLCISGQFIRDRIKVILLKGSFGY